MILRRCESIITANGTPVGHEIHSILLGGGGACIHCSARFSVSGGGAGDCTSELLGPSC